MLNRWTILAVLFLARLTMAFQFQAVAALSPLLIADFGLGLSDIGLLIGLYLAPGVIIAIPGGAIAARFGDKRVVAAGMVLMLVGGALIAMTQQWGVLVAGRFIAGAGGVILNVVMTKMLVDWFEGREISTAMAVFVNSWPVGIALALVTLPAIAASGGVAMAWWAVCTLIAASLLLFAGAYRAPVGAQTSAAEIRATRLPIYALFLAGMVWALYNAALAMVFSFGPALLMQQGWTLISAGSAISVFMIVFSVAVPLGGILADRTGRRDAIILVSLLSFVVLMPVVPYAPTWAVMAIFVAVGIFFALAAGPIMTLPAQVLTPASRSFGMGVFFAIYYGVMMIGPRVVGGMAEAAEDAGLAITAGAVMSLGAIAALGLFRRVRLAVI